jgi:hypothetical protein
MVRTILVLAIICVYTALFNLYIYELYHTNWDMHYVKLLYQYLTIGMLLFYLWDRSAKFKGFFHEQFNKVCVWLVVVNHGIVTIHKHGFDNESRLTWCFNLAVLLTTAIILFCGIRQKTFKYY